MQIHCKKALILVVLMLMIVTIEILTGLAILRADRVYAASISIINTVAGTDTAGYSGDGGAATSAQLENPNGVVIDSSGNLYFADTHNHRIRKVSPDGIISTVAGTGTAGNSGDGGAATSAGLFWPRGLAVDSSGNLYIADHGNHRIRKVSPDGIICTIAGTGSPGYSGDGGAATSAQLKDPEGVAVDSSGNLYIADTDNHRIRKVSPEGIISTMAGTGSAGYSGDGGAATSADLYWPRGLAVDSSGNLYIADSRNHRIRKVSPEGIISTIAGTVTWGNLGDEIAATSAQLYSPRGVVVDSSGNLYIADSSNHQIRKVGTDGIIRTVAGIGAMGYSGDGGAATFARLNYPFGVAVDSSGNLYIADSGNNRIRKVVTIIEADYTDYRINTAVGTGSSGYSGDGSAATSAQLNYPEGVAVDNSGNLYMADTSNHRIRKIGTDGIISTVAGTGARGYSGDGIAATSAQLNFPSGVEVDNSGNLYIADSSNHRIRKVGTDGIISTVAGTGALGYSGDGGAATFAQLYSPSGVGVDINGNLYIADTFNHRIRKVGTDGIISTVAGTDTRGYSGDGGAATSAQLNSPSGVGVDISGNLYIADYSNDRIRKVFTNGIIKTVAGTGAKGYSGDGGAATLAQLDYPDGVAVDRSGNLYIADSWNHRIRKVGTDGIIRTVAGTGIGGYSGDGGDATSAQLKKPVGVVVDSSGNLYVVDSSNNRIRKVVPKKTTAIPDKVLIESNLEGRSITITLDGDTFLATLDKTRFTLNNVPAGLTVASVTRIDDTNVSLVLSYDGTDFDADFSSFTITVEGDQLANNAALITEGMSIAATVESAPTVTTNTVIYVTPSTATAGGDVDSDGGEPVTERGVVYSTSSNPTTSDQKIEQGSGTGSFTANLTGLTASTTYYVRAYAINSVGTSYGNEVSFTAASSGIISTAAGTGTLGYSGDGGAATSAQFGLPHGMAADGHGNLYFADFFYNTIRKISTEGIISTVAGTGSSGYLGDGGVATSAQLNMPTGLAVDGRGNLYIADKGNSRIRKVGTDGLISTVAGTGTAGYSGDGGDAASAQLSYPDGLALDSSGNLYIADEGNSRIRKVGIDGIISTVAGTGSEGYSGDGGAATSAQLNSPSGVLFDSSGNLFIADKNNHSIRKVGTDGLISTLAGTGTAGYSGDEGEATSAQLYYPYGIAFDSSGNLYIADTNNQRIRKVGTNGIISTAGGTGTRGYSGDGGEVISAQLADPYGLAFDNGNLYIADMNNSRIRKVVLPEVIDDIEVPVITLKGKAKDRLVVGSSYTDPGATALDNIDGDISHLVSVTGSVDTSRTGVYILTYHVSDRAGNQAVPLTREITVYQDTSDSDDYSTPQAPPMNQPVSQQRVDDEALSEALKNTGKATLSLEGKTDSTAQLSLDTIMGLAAQATPLTIENSGVKLDIPPRNFLVEEVTGAAGENVVLELGAREAAQDEMMEILQQSPSGESTGLFEVGGKVFDLTAQVTKSNSDGTISTDKIDQFDSPVAVTIDLSGLELSPEDIGYLTGVRYEKDDEGNITPVKLGGEYDPEGGTFTFYTNRFSLYTVMKASDLVKVKLTINGDLIVVNGQAKKIDVVPAIINSRAMVPIRFISEAMAAKVEWLKEAQTVVIRLDGKEISLIIGKLSPGLDTPAVIQDGRTLVPIRYISETLGASVNWFPAISTVEIVK